MIYLYTLMPKHNRQFLKETFFPATEEILSLPAMKGHRLTIVSRIVGEEPTFPSRSAGDSLYGPIAESYAKESPFSMPTMEYRSRGGDGHRPVVTLVPSYRRPEHNVETQTECWAREAFAHHLTRVSFTRPGYGHNQTPKDAAEAHLRQCYALGATGGIIWDVRMRVMKKKTMNRITDAIHEHLAFHQLNGGKRSFMTVLGDPLPTIVLAA